MADLTPRQRHFIDLYMKGRSGAQAYKEAYPNVKNANVARAAAARLLTKGNIIEEIEKRQEELRDKAQIETWQIIRELFRIATSDIRKVFDENGNLLQPYELPEEVARTVASVKYRRITDDQGRESISYHVQLWSKPKALKILTQCLGLD